MSVKERLHKLVDDLSERDAETLLQGLEEKSDAQEGESTLKSFHDKIDEIVSQVPEEEWAKIPADFLDQLDHYIYGTPKK